MENNFYVLLVPDDATDVPSPPEIGGEGASVIGWAPNWEWVGIGTNEKAKRDKLDVPTQFVVNKARGEVIDIRFQAWKGGPRQVVFQYDLSGTTCASRNAPHKTSQSDPRGV